MSKPPNNAPSGMSVEAIYESMPRRQVLITMSCAMVGLFLAALDQTVVSTAMPRIISDLGGFERYAWVTTAYLVASTITVPIVGRLTDLYGRKFFYMLGLVLFMVGSLACGTASSMDQLIAFRALQGMGGGVLLSLAFVIVGDLFPPAERGKIQGVVAAVFGLASVVGPTLGGFITDSLSWDWIFYINLPLGIPLLILMAIFFPAIAPKGEDQKVDIPGIAMLILAVVPLMLAISLSGDADFGWTSPLVLALLTVAVIAGIIFVFVEMRVSNPIMPLNVYRNRVIAVALIATFVTGFGMFSAVIFVPLFFQAGLGASATSSGTFLTPMMLGIVFGAAISGQIVSRLGGYRIPAIFGVVVMAAGILMMSTMSTDTAYALAIGFIVILGFGLGFTFPAYTIAVQNAVEHRFLGVATSTVQFYRTIGGSLGLALLGGLMPSRFEMRLSDRISPEAKSAIGESVLSDISDNPSSMIDSGAMSALAERLGETEVPVSSVLDNMRAALAEAVTDVFFITFFVLIIAIAVTFFLRDAPLRARSSQGSAPPGGA